MGTATEDEPAGPGSRPGGLASLPFRAIGDQPGFEPGDIEPFVAAERIAILAYVRLDGRPGQVPIWYVHRDGALFLSTDTGSAKHRALERDPRVCVTIQDERPPYRAIIFDAVAQIRPMTDGSPTDGIERRYFGRIGGKEYQKLTAEHRAGTALVEVELRPTELRGFDNTHLVGRPITAFLRARPKLPLLRRWL
jgi:PPOX class probable F420-dependent enzyme